MITMNERMLHWIIIFFTLKSEHVARSLGYERSLNINTKNFTIKTTEGSTAILPCEMKEGKNLHIVWMNPKKILISRDDRRFIDDPRMSVERPYLGNWNLHIRHVKYEDRGEYTCTINTRPVYTKRINLMVFVPPKIDEDESSRDMRVSEGKDVRLICQASGIPPPNITWFRKNKRTYGNKERVGEIGDELIIRNISRHCGGEYECMAFNGVETAVQHTIKVDVNFPPEVHLLNTRLGQFYGKETILQCNISASPQAVSVWKFGNIEFGRNSYTNYRTEVYEEDTMRSTLALRILSVKRKDFGIYTCEAENKFGKAKASMELYEYHIPTTPATTTTQKVFTKTVDSPRNSVVIYDKDMEDGNFKVFDFSNSKKPSKKSDTSSQRQNQVVHKELIGNGDRSSASKCSVSNPYACFLFIFIGFYSSLL